MNLRNVTYPIMSWTYEGYLKIPFGAFGFFTSAPEGNTFC